MAAARPSSRSGFGMRPGTGQRLGTASGARTGSRMGTASRLGTAQQAANFGGVGLNTAVNVADRPVTRQGMGGMRVKTAGPGRQVQDVSYYHGLVRARVEAITAELGRMREEMGTRAKNKTTHQTLERKYESLIKEVRGLEGTLADYNLAQDKTRSGVDPAEILAYCDSLHRRNADEARAIDRIFLDRQDVEKGVGRLEAAAAEVQSRGRARLDSLPAAQRAEYAALLERNEHASAAVEGARANLAKLNERVTECEAVLREDVYRDEFALLSKRLELLSADAEAAEAELKRPVSTDAARSGIMNMARSLNEQQRALDAERASIEGETARLRDVARDLDEDMARREGGEGREASYDALFRHDEEMTEFIDRFPATKEKEQAEQARAKETVVALLEHISKGLEREHSMPSQAQAAEMADELQEKQAELEASRFTEEHLQAELARREAEYKKVTGIDADVTAETRALRGRMSTMTAEMAVFSDMERVRSAAQGTIRSLEASRTEYKRRRDSAQTQLRSLAAEYQRKKAMLDSHGVEASLVRLESKLRAKEGQAQAAKEFVADKGRHTEFRDLRAKTLSLSAEINERLKEAASRVVPVVASSL